MKRPREDEDTRPVRFFGPTGEYKELGNFHLLSKPIYVQGHPCPSLEHAYHAYKYIYESASPESLDYAKAIMAAGTPYQSKLLGNRRTSGRFGWEKVIDSVIASYPRAKIDPAWDTRKLAVMEMLLKEKFCSDPVLAKILVSTGTREIQEASPYDSFWGMGRDGKGSNHLGKLLMKLREQLAVGFDAESPVETEEEQEDDSEDPELSNTQIQAMFTK